MDGSSTMEADVEHSHISTALEVQRLDVDLYQSKTLWVPTRARGVFGGQVISQAIASATEGVDSEYGLHSLHCYFLMSASPAVPIIYQIERPREGRSYTSRLVKAIQNGKVIFIMMCSFQTPEPWQPSHQWPMPNNVPQPELCQLEEDRWERSARIEGLDPRVKEVLLTYAEERRRSPIAIKEAKIQDGTSNDGGTYMYWMKAKNIPKYDAPFQKCIVAYLSDFYFIGVAARTLNLRRYGNGPDVVAMMSTLDHSIYFYDDEFHCGEWLLYVMVSPRTGSGRGVVQGRIYTRQGTLIAATSQEGVVRANVRKPSETKL